MQTSKCGTIWVLCAIVVLFMTGCAPCYYAYERSMFKDNEVALVSSGPALMQSIDSKDLGMDALPYHSGAKYGYQKARLLPGPHTIVVKLERREFKNVDVMSGFVTTKFAVSTEYKTLTFVAAAGETYVLKNKFFKKYGANSVWIENKRTKERVSEGGY
jgi:hypothetical protein